jgi:hypothetical protein
MGKLLRIFGAIVMIILTIIIITKPSLIIQTELSGIWKSLIVVTSMILTSMLLRATRDVRRPPEQTTQTTTIKTWSWERPQWVSSGNLKWAAIWIVIITAIILLGAVIFSLLNEDQQTEKQIRAWTSWVPLQTIILVVGIVAIIWLAMNGFGCGTVILAILGLMLIFWAIRTYPESKQKVAEIATYTSPPPQPTPNPEERERREAQQQQYKMRERNHVKLLRTFPIETSNIDTVAIGREYRVRLEAKDHALQDIYRFPESTSSLLKACEQLEQPQLQHHICTDHNEKIVITAVENRNIFTMVRGDRQYYHGWFGLNEGKYKEQPMRGIPGAYPAGSLRMLAISEQKTTSAQIKANVVFKEDQPTRWIPYIHGHRDNETDYLYGGYWLIAIKIVPDPDRKASTTLPPEAPEE